MKEEKSWFGCESFALLSGVVFWKWMAFALIASASFVHAEPVELLRTPNGGIQPQAVMDDDGVLHLVYFKGEAGGGDIFYIRRAAGSGNFSKPIRVNSQSGSAVAAGTIRGAQMAVGMNGRVHVAWNGGAGAVRPLLRGEPITPMLYSRLNDDATGFEPERNLITSAAGLDGGGGVAADAAGNVFVTWHGSPPGNDQGEAGRAVFVARSLDEGKTFQPEEKANADPTGACGCCGMATVMSRDRSLHLLYRSAFEMVHRDPVLLSSGDAALPSAANGISFQGLKLDEWRINVCPLSGFSLAQSKNGVLAAWENSGEVYFTEIDFPESELNKRIGVSGGENKKNPALAVNAQGKILMAWTEGTGWARGGGIGWQVFDKTGEPVGETGSADGSLAWSFPAAVSLPGGTFLVIY